MHGIHRQIHTSPFFYKASRVPRQLRVPRGGANSYCTPQGVTPCWVIINASSTLLCQRIIPAQKGWRIIHDRNARLPPRSLGIGAWMTSQLKVASIRKLCWSLMCLAISFIGYPWLFVQPCTGRRPVDWCRN